MHEQFVHYLVRCTRDTQHTFSAASRLSISCMVLPNGPARVYFGLDSERQL